MNTKFRIKLIELPKKAPKTEVEMRKYILMDTKIVGIPIFWFLVLVLGLGFIYLILM